MKDFCCSKIELIEENEIISSYGGNLIYRDTYICKECNKVFYMDTNDYSYEEDFIEETDISIIKSLINS